MLARPGVLLSVRLLKIPVPSPEIVCAAVPVKTILPDPR